MPTSLPLGALCSGLSLRLLPHFPCYVGGRPSGLHSQVLERARHLVGSLSLRDHSRSGRATVSTTSRRGATPAALPGRADPRLGAAALGTAGNSGNSHPLLMCSRMGSQRPGMAHHCAIAWRMYLLNLDARGRAHVDLNPAVSPDSRMRAMRGSVHDPGSAATRARAQHRGGRGGGDHSARARGACPARPPLVAKPSAPRRPRTKTDIDPTYPSCGTFAAALYSPYPSTHCGVGHTPSEPIRRGVIARGLGLNRLSQLIVLESTFSRPRAHFGN
jgi:hypothetical protein